MKSGPEKTSHSSQTIDLIPTGITALDENIGGGLPHGSFILLGGKAGTGKSLFASRFLYEGATKHGERGVYVSFLENKANFSEFMKRLGYNFAKLEEEGKYRFLGFPTIEEEGVSMILAQIIGDVQKTHTRRLVIDSFTAITKALSGRIEPRMALHEIFSKIARAMNCTSMLITETSTEEESIGLEPEEFLADAVFILKRTEFDERPLRILDILKTRGQRISTPRMLFTLENGFEIYSPLREPSSPPNILEWKPIPDNDGKFSTGNKDLDSLLGGGYERGSYVLIDVGENVPPSIRRLFTTPLMLNFISQSRGVTVVPRPDSSAGKIKESLAMHISEEKIRSLLRVFEKKPQITEDSISLPYEGLDAEVDYEYYVEVWEDLKKRTDGRPVLRIVAEDTDEYMYGLRGILAKIPQSVTRTAVHGDLSLAVAGPHLECTKHLAHLANIHLRLREYRGYVLVYGVKPRTNIQIAEIDISNGAPELKLHQVR